jgi:hypothetical protein
MKERTRILFLLPLVPVLFLLLSSSSPARNESSCVSCHTDETQLKKTCKPFVVPEGEGEG